MVLYIQATSHRTLKISGMVANRINKLYDKLEIHKVLHWKIVFM